MFELRGVMSISSTQRLGEQEPYKNVKAFGNLLGALLSGVFTVLTAMIVVLVLFASQTSFAPFPYRFNLPMAASVLLSCGVITVAVYLATKAREMQQNCVMGILLVLNLVLLALQFLIVVSISYTITWDPGTIMRFAEAAATRGNAPDQAWYYDMFSNNNLLTVLFIFLCKMLPLCDLGIVAGLLGAFLVNASCYLVALTVYKITASASGAIAAWCLYAVLGCLSPWIAVPYSDTYATFFVSVSVFLFSLISRGKNNASNVLLGFGFGLAIFVGGMIKPTVLVVAVAAALACLVGLASRARMSVTKAALFAASGVAVAALLCYGCISPLLQAEVDRYYTPNHEAAISYTHYLMMGANSERYGYFSYDDYAISTSIESYECRQKANLQEWKRRLQQFGPLGYAVFLSKKLTITFNDGTFDLGGEGQRMPPKEQHLKANPLGSLSQFLRSMFYVSKKDKSPLWEFSQVVWLAVLLMLPLSSRFFAKERRAVGSPSNTGLCLMVAIVGLALFLLLFETRSRYLLCLLPVFCSLAGCGFVYIVDVASKRKAGSGKHAKHKVP